MPSTKYKWLKFYDREGWEMLRWGVREAMSECYSPLVPMSIYESGNPEDKVCCFH